MEVSGRTFFEKFSKREMALLCFSVAVIVGALYLIIQLSKNEAGNQNSLGLKQIGTLETFGSDVKRKFHGEPDFSESKNLDPLFQKDTVFVGPGSRAKFILPEYGTFELQPNSVVLVVLDFEKKLSHENSPSIDKNGAKGIRLKLIQGNLKFEAAKVPPTAVDSPETQNNKSGVFIEIADNTVIDLSDQQTVTLDKKKDGNFEVSESSHELRAFVASSDPTQKPQESIVPLNQPLSPEALTKPSSLLSEKLTSTNSPQDSLELVPAMTLPPTLKRPTAKEANLRSGAKSQMRAEDNKTNKEILNEYAIEKANIGQVSRKTASTQNSNDNNEIWSEYHLSPSTFYSAIRSKDKSSGGTANFYSKQNFGLASSWSQHWNKEFSSLLGLNIKYESWDQNFANSRILVNRTYLTSNIDVGGKMRLSNLFEFMAQVSIGQDSFRVSQNSGAEIRFETPVLAKFILEGKKYFLINNRFGVGLGLASHTILPRTFPQYSVELSPGLKLASNIRQELSEGYMEAGIFYAYQKLNSSILEETRSSFGLSLSWGFGKKESKKSESINEESP